MSFEEDVDVYGECRNFIKFCKEQGIQVTSEAVATVWAAFQTNVALDDDDDEEATLDDYDLFFLIFNIFLQLLECRLNFIYGSTIF